MSPIEKKTVRFADEQTSETETFVENASETRTAVENDEELAEWNASEQIDKVLNSIDPEETDVNVMASAAHKCLKTMALNDAAEYMIEKQFPITEENIKIFMQITQQAYFARLKIMKDNLIK